MIKVLHRGSFEWDEASAFVSRVFEKTYGASITSFMPHFIKMCDRKGDIRAIVGYRPASSGKLFLENYLDLPVEEVLSKYLGTKVDRSSIVEVGNLAEQAPGDGRMAIIAATAFLHSAGYRWVVFTGVPRLRNAFARLGLIPQELAPADESRLPEKDQGRWGNYYKNRPVVYFGDIKQGHDNLQELWFTLKSVWSAAEDAGRSL